MAGRLPRLPGVVASIDTAGEGFFIGVSIYVPGNAGGLIISGVNQTWARQFVLPFRAIVRQILTEVTTGAAAGKKYGVGLYDVDKNLLVETGAIDAEATGVSSTSVTAITLEPGVYWFAQTADDTTTGMKVLGSATQTSYVPINDNTVRGGRAANASSAGVLPATLGTITADTGRTIVLAVFEP